MKGILKKTTGGFFVWYDKPVDEAATAYDSLPLHPKATEGWSVTEREDFFKKFVDKTIEFEVVNETITGEFSAMGGGYTNYQVQFAKPIKPKFDWEYWKHRCLAAEQFIEEIKVGDIHYEYELGVGIKCEVTTLPILNKIDDKWVVEYSECITKGGKKGVLGGYTRSIKTKTLPLLMDSTTFPKDRSEFVIGSRVKFKEVLINPMGREVDPNNLGQNHSECIWYAKLVYDEDGVKDKQKQHLIDMMKSDEELGLYDEKIEDIELEEVRGSSHCQFSVVENKLAIIYRNQLKTLQAIKMLNNGTK